jgi:hypothetical protein
MPSKVGRVAVEQHGRENSHSLLCDRPCGPTRVISLRQLLTDHDYAALTLTREYQTDQPSTRLTRSLPALPSQRKQNHETSTPTPTPNSG